MALFEQILASAVVQALGWTLLHSLWQGALLALLAALLRRSRLFQSANARYALASGALLCMLLAPAATLWFSLTDSGSFTMLQTARQEVALQESTAVAALWKAETAKEISRVEIEKEIGALSWRSRASLALQPYLPWMVGFWLAGVFLLSLRLIGGWTLTGRLKISKAKPLGGPLLAKLQHLQQKMRITRPVLLLESAWVQVPTVIGWLRPAILLPASVITGLTASQVESLLAHELAHIRRHDFFVNLLQSMVETLLFYHPAAWWISEWIRIEREHCCDDWAVAVCGSPLPLARALTDLEAWRVESGVQLAMAATGGVLLHRVRRLLGVSDERQDAPVAWPLAGLLLLAGLAGGAALFLSSSNASAPDPGTYSKNKPMQNTSLWCTVSKNGRSLVFEPYRLISAEGVGKLRIMTEDNSILLPEDHTLFVDGQLFREGKIESASTLLQSKAADGRLFWTFRLESGPTPENQMLPPNVVGSIALEPEYPSSMRLQFSKEGAYFQTVPARSKVVLGVLLEGVDEAMAAKLALKPGIGILIQDAPVGMPAGDAGMQAKDVVVALENGEPASFATLSAALMRKQPGEILEMTVRRADKDVKLRIQLAARETHQAAMAAVERKVKEMKEMKESKKDE